MAATQQQTKQTLGPVGGRGNGAQAGRAYGNRLQALADWTGGVPVNRPDEILAPHLKGGNRYYGLGTYENYGRKPERFTTGKRTVIGPEIAEQLNRLLGQGAHSLGDANGPFFQGEKAVQQYSPDVRASITVGANGQTVLPGSQAAIDANNQGLALGNVYVTSPITTTGRRGTPRAGSLVYFANLFALAENNVTRSVDPVELDHYFAQSGIYLLGPLFKEYGLTVVQSGSQKIDLGDQGVVESALYATVDQSGKFIDPASWILSNIGFAKAAKKYYQAFKSIDSVTKGVVGQQALIDRHPEWVGANTPEARASLAARLEGAVKQGSVAGTYKYAGKFANRANRKGARAFPLTNVNDGTALGYGMPATADYSCNLWSSGPGVTESAQQGGERGYHLTYSRAGTRSKALFNGQAGRSGAAVPKCVLTNSRYVNPKRNVYQGPSIRTGNNQRLYDYAVGQYADQLQGDYDQWQAGEIAAGNPFVDERGFGRWKGANKLSAADQTLFNRGVLGAKQRLVRQGTRGRGGAGAGAGAPRAPTRASRPSLV